MEGVRFIRDTIASRRVAVVLDLDSTLLESEFLPSGQPADWCVHVCVRGGWWIPGRVDPVGAGRRLLLYRRMYHRLPTALSGGAPP